MLKARIHGTGPQMWDEILDEWGSDPGATLVLPGNLARDSFLSGLPSGTLWEYERVKTLSELWSELAAGLSGLPAEIFPAELEPRLAEMVADYPELSALLDSTLGLDLLGQHLELIDRQADLDYRPTTAVEKEIHELRQEMMSRGAVTPSARRSMTARRSKEIRLGGRLLFSPLPEPSRQLGGLLKGLGRQNEILLYLLGSEKMARASLGASGLLAEAQIEVSSRGPSDELWGKGCSANTNVTWHRADDPVRAAIGLASDLIEEGFQASEVAIVSPSGRSEELAVEAALHGLPILVREAVETRETPVGSMLLHLSDLDLDDPYAVRIAMRETGLESARLEELRVPKASKLRALLHLGQDLIGFYHSSGSGLAHDIGRSQAWIEGLERVVVSLERSQTVPWDIPTVISGIRSSRLPRGSRNGVKVLGPGEVGSFRLDALVFIELDNGSYPPGPSPSPFASEQLLRQVPSLRGVDRKPEFVAALAQAPRVALVRSASARGQERIPSPFYLESQRAWEGKESPADSSARRYLARHAAGKALRASPEIEQALEQARRERIPERAGGSRPSNYSVTELETYLRCPYGWFVQSVIRPGSRPSGAALTGSLIHETLERLLGGEFPDAAERIHALPGLVLDLADGRIPERELPVIEARIERILESFSGPAWSFDETRVEVPLMQSYERDGDEVVIRGRADRIDFLTDPESGQQEILVIDYKSNRPPPRNQRLQPFLYPRMAASEFKAEIIGFAYLSIRSGSATAHLRRQLPALQERGGPGWDRGENGAIRSLVRAVEGIEQGQWSEAGRNCPPWCPHRQLSSTGVPS